MKGKRGEQGGSENKNKIKKPKEKDTGRRGNNGKNKSNGKR